MLVSGALLQMIVFFFKKKLFIFLKFWLHWVFVAVCGLFVAAHRSSLVAVQELLVAAASLIVEHGL